jgi:hypothetical protein
MKNIFRRIFFGDVVITEYSTITIEGDIREAVYLKSGNQTLDISSTHWLLCLDPIVFGVWVDKKENIQLVNREKKYKIYFDDSSDVRRKNNHVAILHLDLFDRIEEKQGSLFLLKLNKSRIYHTNPLKTILLFYKYYRKPGLSLTKLKGFASAYSYPRKVRVISFKEGGYYNIFPMDLVGAIPGSHYYAFGLRHTNIALSKIINAKKLVVSEFSYEHKDAIYNLGKHHSVAPPSLEMLPFKVKASKHFDFYIPEWVDSYKEIEIKKTMNLGSHMLMWGEWMDDVVLKPSTGHLYHIHFLHYFHQKGRGAYYPLI